MLDPKETPALAEAGGDYEGDPAEQVESIENIGEIQRPEEPGSGTQLLAGHLDLRNHVEMIHGLAGKVPGVGNLLVVSCYGEAPDELDPKTGRPGKRLPAFNRHFPVGDVAGTLAAIQARQDERHRNQYMPLAVYGPGLGYNAKGSEAEIIAVLGLVVDFDDDEAPRWSERLPLPPDYVINSSGGRFQCFYMFAEPVDMVTAKAVATRMKLYTKGDHCSSDMCHVWRVPGCLNWPTAKKVHKDGRSRDPQPVKVALPWTGSLTRFEDLGEALPPLAVAVPQSKPVKPQPVAATEVAVSAAVRPDFNPINHIGSVNSRLRCLLMAPAVLGTRSGQFYAQVAALIVKHLTDAEIAKVLQHNPNGAWTKYAEGGDRVVQEVARCRSNISAESDAAHTLLNDLEERWVYVSAFKKFMDPDTGATLDKEAMNDYYAYTGEKVAQALLTRPSFRRALAVDYLPSHPLIAGGVLNLWRPSGLEPVAGDVAPFIKHMELLIPTEWERNHYLDCCAHMVQHPGKKLRQASLIQGNQRVGKSLIARVMERCVGLHNTVVAENNHLDNRFNGWMAGKALVVIEELMQHGRLEVYNKMKPWITQETVEVEKKGRDHVTMKNVSNFMCFTNHKDSILIEDDDARFFVVFSPLVKQSNDYYTAFFEGWLFAGGDAAALHWLLNRDLEHFNPNAPAPMTDAKAKMIGETRIDLHKVLVRRLEDCSTPFDRPVFTADEVRAQIGFSTKEGAVERQLAKVGCTSLGQIRAEKSSPAKVRLWSRPTHDDVPGSKRDWTAAKESDMREAWKKRLG